MGKGIKVDVRDRLPGGPVVQSGFEVSERLLELTTAFFSTLFEMGQATAEIIEDVSEMKKRKRR